ncbi:ImmA/IrrE family metallo-endopeptidase [Apibacter sp. B2912]|uniref:ImmA/IrrE family metallo-endopeptidase n=1 Tax=Apibacter sp. B2912 TaxID=2656763 RepID=UPI00136C9086|nr:ImmA/IrrE family metallo-endopeptidase [Apibacter sp. B2912]MXO31613.1 ImmA/IrrE family metallo-endopeptidase [Apibacter sp. B2912]
MINHRIEKITFEILKKLRIKKVEDINLFRISENLGIDVKGEDMNSDISGIFVVKESNAYIRYNNTESEVRQRFTIAHELGHFVLHKDIIPLFIDRDEKIMYRNSESTTGEIRKEREANSFAASLLMPIDFIKYEINKVPLYEDNVPYLAEKFKVSEQAMIFRLANLGYDIGYF